ncbi:MAG TPA: hypothetical protein VH560_12815 [Polyangia bacterium]|jgi:hypothetical protein|nr:hypothetical protein [Polyangia bacterium]
MRALTLSALAVTLIAARGASAATTTADLAYGEDNCRFAAWPACPATGACPPPSTLAGDTIYHLDDSKLEPQYPQSNKANTSLTFLCPVTRSTFGGSGEQLTVNVSGQAPAQTAQALSCTLYHYDDYGTLLGSVAASASTPTEGTATRVYLESLTIRPGTLDGPYAIACSLPVDTKHTTTGGIFSYRSEQTVTSAANTTSQMLPPSVCVPASPLTYNGKPSAAVGTAQLRYFYALPNANGLQNTGSTVAPIECPVQNFVSNGTARHVRVYITEPSANAAGSTCHLAARTPYYTNDVLASDPSFTKTTSTGNTQRTLDFTDSNTSYVDPLGYMVECSLKPGATLNSIRFGSF